MIVQSSLCAPDDREIARIVTIHEDGAYLAPFSISGP
jgi:hypothetical protein